MDGYNLKRSCWLEISLDNVRDNFFAFKKMVGPDVKVLHAVKANAYGHGIVPCGKELEACGADYLGMGSISEAIKLRENGVKMPLLVFASNTIEEVAELYIQYHLIPTILSEREAKAISDAASSPVPVFVKIDTGRGRLGVNAEEFPDFYRKITALPNLYVEGVYSHMAAVNWPDVSAEYGLWQYERFSAAIEVLGEEGKKIPFCQLANTPGGIALPEIRMTGVCPGRAIWGYSPLDRREGHPQLKHPITAWKSRLIHINQVCGGKFGENYKAVKLDSPKRIGIMAGGLGDGISPKLAGGYVLLHGRKAKVASTISLEHTIIDLADFPDAKVGDEIVILGRQGDEEITMEQRMEEWGRGVPSFWIEISSHTARCYYKEGKLLAVSESGVLQYI